MEVFDFERKQFEITTESKTEYVDGLVVLENAEISDPNHSFFNTMLRYNLGFDYRINPNIS